MSWQVPLGEIPTGKGAGFVGFGSIAQQALLSQISYATYAAIRAATPVANQLAWMKGYYATNDGGEGFFVWDAASSATHNGGTIIQLAAGGTGRWLRSLGDNQVTPQMFGSLDDNDNTKTANFTAWLTYWKATDGPLALAPQYGLGIYSTTAVQNLTNPFSEMKGDGNPCFRYSGVAATKVFSITDVTRRQDFKIRNIAFDGGANGQGVFHMHNVARASVEDVDIWGAAVGFEGMFFESVVLCELRNLSVTPEKTPAFAFSSQPDAGIILGSGATSATQFIANILYNPIVEHVASTGLGLINAADNIFIGGSCESNGGPGLDIRAISHRNKFITMFFEANGAAGAGPDITCAGDGNSFDNCEAFSTTAMEISGDRNQVLGGRYKNINNSGDGNIYIGVAIADAAGWTNTGTNTIMIGCWNETTGLFYPNLGIYPSVQASFSAHKNGTPQVGVADATQTLVTWSTEVYDVGSKFASDTWTPPAGKVQMCAGLSIAGTLLVGATFILSIYKNGSIFKSSYENGAATGAASGVISIQDVASGTDAYTVRVYIDLDSGTGTIAGGATDTYFMGSMM